MRNRLEGGGQHLLLRPADEFAKPPVDRQEPARHISISATPTAA